ncbi:MAG TPA: hypothetical protein VHN77_04415 [Phycisphaerales bacterium]|nr:hypothetical protein [Phycisphaerales bacterium]
MVVIADTSPVNYLVQTDHAWLLERLYRRVIVPRAVLAELSDPRSPAAVRAFAADLPQWIEVRTPGRLPDFRSQFGDGEAEAIALCLENTQHLLLIDDRPARARAEALGVRCLGLLGTIREAHQRAIIDGHELLSRLRSTSMYLPSNFTL